jgi:hypothetical protein
MEQKKGVAIELKYHEALVLFEWLSNFIDDTELEGLLPQNVASCGTCSVCLRRTLTRCFPAVTANWWKRLGRKLKSGENGSEACE